MALSFPLALPDTPGAFRRFSMSTKSVVAVAQSPFSLKEQRQAYSGMIWIAGITLPPMKRPIAAKWIGFLRSLNGKEGTFLLGDPAGASPQGEVGTSAPLVNGASQTGRTLITDGWDNGITGVILSGDYIQLSSGATSRLHQVVQDADSDGGGNATLEIWPELRESPANSSAIVLLNTKGVFRLAGNTTSTEVDFTSFYGLGFSAQEVL